MLNRDLAILLSLEILSCLFKSLEVKKRAEQKQPLVDEEELVKVEEQEGNILIRAVDPDT